MVRYVLLLNWTDQGIASVKGTVDRYRAAKQLLESKGGSFEAIAWTVGHTTSYRSSPSQMRRREPRSTFNWRPAATFAQ